jgi:ABC-type transport system involved in cytochrome c biogenesis permease component
VTYLADVGALARKDLLLELRSRDTLPAMILFVVSTLVVFNFSLPAETGDLAAYGLLWVAIVFTAILGLTRAFAAEREQRVLDGLVLAPCDRSAIWLGKGISVVAFLALAEVVALPAFGLFFEPVTWELVAAVALGGGEPGARASPPAPLPAARHPRRRRRRGCLDCGRPRTLPRLPRPLRPDLCDPVLGEL